MSYEMKKPLPPEVQEQQRDPELELEDAFYSFVESLDETTKKTLAFKRIFEQAEDTGEYKQALADLRRFLDKRRSSLDHVSVSWENPELELDKDGMQQMIRRIRFAASNPDAFLGNGAVAEVFTLSQGNTRLCAKLVMNYERYAEGVLTTKEIEFLDELRNLEVSGVRAPKPYFAFSTISMDGIVMEKLDAVNFRRVIEGQTTEGMEDVLPPEFNIDTFFKSLESYVKEMHKMGIYHGDLHLRNMMIDRETGLPRIIDFGKGKFERERDHTKAYPDDFAAKDLESLRLAKIEAKQWLEGQSKQAA